MPASSDPSLIVVRGAYRGTDPTYACTAHDTQPGRYLMLEVQDGKVQKRTVVPASDRRLVEETMQGYRGVYVDKRADGHLLPLSAPAHALEADLDRMRRAKSDDELRSLRGISAHTRAQLGAADVSTATFRGAAQAAGYKSSFERKQAHGFTQYRGGVQDARGRCSDLTRVEAKTPEWEARLRRAYRGLDAVRAQLKVGAAVADLDRTFMRHMDPQKDVVYGSVVHHTGYESHEETVPLKNVERFDFLTLGAAVGDGKETALLYRSAHAMGEEDAYGAIDPLVGKQFKVIKDIPAGVAKRGKAPGFIKEEAELIYEGDKPYQLQEIKEEESHPYVFCCFTTAGGKEMIFRLSQKTFEDHMELITDTKEATTSVNVQGYLDKMERKTTEIKGAIQTLLTKTTEDVTKYKEEISRLQPRVEELNSLLAQARLEGSNESAEVTSLRSQLEAALGEVERLTQEVQQKTAALEAAEARAEEEGEEGDVALASLRRQLLECRRNLDALKADCDAGMARLVDAHSKQLDGVEREIADALQAAGITPD